MHSHVECVKGVCERANIGQNGNTVPAATGRFSSVPPRSGMVSWRGAEANKLTPLLGTSLPKGDIVAKEGLYEVDAEEKRFS